MIRSGLDTAFVGRNLIYFSQLPSTNNEARRLAADGAPDGTLVVADFQTAGRGRLDRRWIAPPQSSLLLSLVLRPQLAADRIQYLTMISGLAVVDAIEAETGLRTALKWPNDILYGGAKLGGILTETEVTGSSIDAAIIGIGLNVNLHPDELPDDLLLQATSLSHALGHPVARLPLLKSLLRAIERRYLALRQGADPRREWARRLDTLGKHIALNTDGEELEGVAEGVDEKGALQVRLRDGRLVTVLVGDVIPL